MQPQINAASALTPVERSLRDSLLVSEIRDVHLYAFSRRTILSNRAPRINYPLPVAAISSILKNTECFSKLLANPAPVQQHAYSSEYDYESDSDLEEFEELPVEDPSPPRPGPSSAEGSSPEGAPKDRSEDPTSDQPAAKGSTVTAVKRYREVPVPNIAYQTLRACVFYLYTGKTNFLPLTSSGAADRQLALLTTSNDLAPPCSPKSMYRLAELYGLTELQDLAYKEVISQLSPENILDEAFSTFFVRYHRLREHAISYLSQNYSKPPVQRSLPDVLQRIAMGELPHAGGVLRSLLGLPVAISPSALGRIPHARVIKSTHPPAIKLPSPSPFATDWQSLFKSRESCQPVVPVTSEPLLTEPPVATTSPGIASSSAVNSSVIPPSPLDGEALAGPRILKKKRAKRKL